MNEIKGAASVSYRDLSEDPTTRGVPDQMGYDEYRHAGRDCPDVLGSSPHADSGA